MPDAQRYNRPNGPGRRDRGSLASWIPILIFLFCFPPVGVLLLVLRLLGITGRRRPVVRHPYDLQREAAERGSAAPGPQEPWTQSAPADAGRKDKKKHAAQRGDRAPGKGLILTGGIVAAVFGVAALSSFLDALSWGGLLYSLEDIFVPLAFCGGGLCTAWYGFRKNRRAKRYRQYLSLIGRRESISVATLAEATGFSPQKIREDLQDMLDDGVFPTGYLDLGTDRLILSGEGIQDRPEEPPQEPPKKDMEREEAVLAEIRALNDAIEDAEMSRKIDRIGEITGNIFAYLREKPDKEGKLRSFLSYYLPTTLKILRSYARLEAQGVEGENITAAKARIEGMMDQVVEGFEKQLDKLFSSDAMDIAADVQVLENMLKKDGLSGDDMNLK